MDNFAHLDLQDCPLCGGVGSIEEENGWLVFVQCLDCGSRTAEMAYNSEEERQEMARRVVTAGTSARSSTPAMGIRPHTPRLFAKNRIFCERTVVLL